MRSAATRALCQAASALQQQQAPAAGRVALVACSTGALPFSTSSESKQQQQQQSQLPLPSVQALLGPKRAGTRITTTSLAAGMAAGPSFDGPTYVQPGTNPWTSLREQYGFEKRNSLSPAMYLNIMVFGFASWFTSISDLPPRVLGMMSLLFVALYVRRR